MAKAKGLSNIEKKSGARKRTRQGLGRGTKFSTKVGSKRFKKRYRGQGKWEIQKWKCQKTNLDRKLLMS